MKCTTNIIFLCIAFGFIDLVFSQLPTYGSSSSGGGVSRGRGNVGGGSRQGSGGFNRGSGSSVQGTRGGGGNSGSGGDHQGLDWLRDSVPGEPGVDYPIYGLPVPESSFSCDGRVKIRIRMREIILLIFQVEGGYYSDTELQCQAFQICVHDSVGGLVKYSFLCPNGSLFDQQYFVCDYWFNVDCSQAESLYSLNDQLAAERESNIGATAAPETGIGAAQGRGGQGSFGGNSFNGRGTNSGARGSSSNRNRGNNRQPSTNIQTGYGAPRSTRDLESEEIYEDDYTEDLYIERNDEDLNSNYDYKSAQVDEEMSEGDFY